MAAQVAWLGLGNMGRAMSRNLVKKGNLEAPLMLYNRTTQRTHDMEDELGNDKVTLAKTVGEVLAQSNIIFMCLGDDAAVTDIIATAVKGDVKDKLFIDCSTVHPDTTNNSAQLIESHGGYFVACPVFGAPAMADKGQLVCVLAGPASQVERVRPYCKGVMGRATIEFPDESPGKATLLKIVGNTFILNIVESLAEGHTLAEKSGLGTENLHHFIETMFPGPYTAYSNRLIGGDYYKREEPLFGVDLARTNARHALDLAKEAGAKIKNVEVADGHLLDVQHHMGSRGDIAGIYGAVRQESGLKFENGEK